MPGDYVMRPEDKRRTLDLVKPLQRAHLIISLPKQVAARTEKLATQLHWLACSIMAYLKATLVPAALYNSLPHINEVSDVPERYSTDLENLRALHSIDP